MQLLPRQVQNTRKLEGLGLINADVLRLPMDNDYRLPHWMEHSKIEKECPLIKGLESGCFMYFVHDYAVECHDLRM